jgi:anti-sigma regulatory factor (Ser/Thr protein kinase)
MRFAYRLDGSVEELQALRSSVENWAESIPQLADELMIVVSELAANAITHGQAPAEVAMTRTGQRVRMSVQQHLRTPTTFPSMSDQAHGRQGLRLVDRLSTSWGWGATANTLTVWAELQ